MYKENGRHKPAEENETANIKSKKLTCKICGASEHFTGLQFGEKIKCTASTCNGIMEEDTYI